MLSSRLAAAVAITVEQTGKHVVDYTAEVGGHHPFGFIYVGRAKNDDKIQHPCGSQLALRNRVTRYGSCTLQPQTNTARCFNCIKHAVT